MALVTQTYEKYGEESGARVNLYCPRSLPQSSGFLWNKNMMIQVNCRGYTTAQFMQPEPAKYAYAPNLEAKTFMQPEQPYYAHHPGRFFYLKDEDNGEVFSIPYAPVKTELDVFKFSLGLCDISWEIEHIGFRIKLSLSLPAEDVVELWDVSLENISECKRRFALYSYFPFGYMSWMNQGGGYSKSVGGIIARCITPYQKVDQYFEHKEFKDLSYFLHSDSPDSWEVLQALFEGDGGLHNPSAIGNESLSNSEACYETPAAVLQYRIELDKGEQKKLRFVFGPAKDENEILAIRERYLDDPNGFEKAHQEYKQYLSKGEGILKIETPDVQLNEFVNNWLPRQVYYHGDVNRLSTDPQTRNYLQDNMGMSYVQPSATRKAFLLALSQQNSSGAMPDGIIVVDGAELKYINQIPHTDHCCWLPICIKAYLDETGDYSLLDEHVVYSDKQTTESVFEHVQKALQWLVNHRDERGLSFIEQGDWCDPMNMVGYKGKGVSAWLTLATSYALQTWADICEVIEKNTDCEQHKRQAQELNSAANKYFWDGQWFGRGITDDDVLFGIQSDAEGKIFLNPQSWAILANAVSDEQIESLMAAIEEQLETPYGACMIAPAYTAMREDVGRVTQKFPGSAENGSIYNHAAAFYVYALYTIKKPDKAYDILRKMVPGPDDQDYIQRGQLPVFIPNYYRGAYYQFPRTAGRSSQLFNTGTVHWFYRCIVEGLLGLKGDRYGLCFEPNLPQGWNNVRVVRTFRGATFHVEMSRTDTEKTILFINGKKQPNCHFREIEAGCTYKVELYLPVKMH